MIKNIDIKKGDESSKIASDYAKKSYKNSNIKLMNIENGFSNGFELESKKIGISSDGIGTKVEIAERINCYKSLGFDLVAMIIDDLISNGYNPILISNILDVDRLDKKIINALFNGLNEACSFSDIIISGGEIAELGNRVGGYGNSMHINWSATGIGTLFEYLDYPVDGKNIDGGEKIYAIRSNGFRSNGFTLARSILENSYGKDWHNVIFEGKSWGEILLTKSLIYTPFIRELFQENIEIKAIVHITGGGIYNNLNRVIPKGKTYKLDSLLKPHKVMVELQKLGNISDKKAYLNWNMGHGMLIISDENINSKIINNQKYEVSIVGKIE